MATHKEGNYRFKICRLPAPLFTHRIAVQKSQVEHFSQKKKAQESRELTGEGEDQD